MIPLSLVPTTGRECGECQACCFLLHIPELNKSAWTKCKNQCDKGCAIYQDRPSSCRNWDCMWLKGHITGDVRHRPDKLGLMFDIEWPLLEKFGHTIMTAYEVWEGAAQEQQGKYVLDKLANKYTVIIKKMDKTYTVLPISQFQSVEKMISSVRDTAI